MAVNDRVGEGDGPVIVGDRCKGIDTTGIKRTQSAVIDVRNADRKRIAIGITLKQIGRTDEAGVIF